MEAKDFDKTLDLTKIKPYGDTMNDGKYVGYLTIVSGVGTPTGTFSGDVTLTGITEGTEQTFGFFYLGSAERTLEVGAESAVVDFSSQEIYADANGKLANAGKHHVGYGTAKGTVTDGIVTGINVTLVSKVALACFSFKKNSTDYTDELTLSGTNIYNEMTVNFNGSFNHGATPGNITLTAGHGERYVMLVPTGDATEQTLTFACGSEVGGGKVPGLQSNKFYGKSDAIAVSLHEYVDLGLPSDLLWATCNLGASKPEEYGDYYQWGGVTPVTSTDINVGWDGCPFTNDTFDPDNNKKVFTKYVPKNKSEYWAGEGDPDNKLVLESSDDAATVAWGSDWRMPTEAELAELKSNTTQTWKAANAGITIGGQTVSMPAAGYYCVSKKAGYTDKYIFLPAAGWRKETSLNNAGSWGCYWLSSLYESPEGGRVMSSFSMNFGVSFNNRYLGSTVRPVWPTKN